MPELPEVEAATRHLSPLISGRRTRRLDLLDDILVCDPLDPPPRRVARVLRIGKQIVFELARRGEETVWLAVHLRMTGRLVWAPRWRAVDERHLRARLVLAGGAVLFQDPRRLGTIQLHRRRVDLEPSGLDPTSDAFTPDALRPLLGQGRQEIKVWLLRQDRLVGVGNIYASEILFEARIDPRRQVRTLDARERRRLHRAIRGVLRRAIDNCEATFSDFQTSRGVTEAYGKLLAVYRRQGAPCRVCGASIQRLVQQQRSTFLCPRCQGDP